MMMNFSKMNAVVVLKNFFSDNVLYSFAIPKILHFYNIIFY